MRIISDVEAEIRRAQAAAAAGIVKQETAS
jgi:hypothetical protein